MKNMGLSQLVLVNPHCDPLEEESWKTAVHAKEILDNAQVVPSLVEALVDCQRAIATIGRTMTTLSMPLEHPRTALPWLGEVPSALIFGPEDRGLSSIELNYAQRLVSIPTTEVYPSLNLAQAVGICCYELRQSLSAPTPPVHASHSEQLQEDSVSLDALNQYLQHLEAVLLDIGYLQAHTAESRMKKLRQIYKNANLSESDLALLRGIVRQTHWAVTKTSL
jgi:tRNA/rRNA methyltransferase